MAIITLDTLQDRLLEDHCAHIPFSATTTQVDSAVEAFFEMYTLPIHEKQKLLTLAVPGDDAFTCGYEVKRRKFGQKDNKDMFHDNRQLRRNLEGVIRSADPSVRNFLDKSWPVYLAVEEQARAVIPTLEPYAPGITEKFFPHGKDPLIFLRYLAYLEADADDPAKGFLALDHYDQAPFTTAIKESKRGLAVGKPGNLKPVTHKPGHSIGFFGPNILNVIPQENHDKIPLGYHGARHIPDAEHQFELPQGVMRCAVVGFVWAQGLKFLPYEVCHPEAKQRGYCEGPRSKIRTPETPSMSSFPETQ